MKSFRLSVTIGLLLAAGPALAQPFIIELQKQPAQQGTQAQPPAVSAPPIAPPQAGPSLPSTTDVAGATRVAPQEETAQAPAPPQ